MFIFHFFFFTSNILLFILLQVMKWVKKRLCYWVHAVHIWQHCTSPQQQWREMSCSLIQANYFLLSQHYTSKCGKKQSWVVSEARFYIFMSLCIYLALLILHYKHVGKCRIILKHFGYWPSSLIHVSKTQHQLKNSVHCLGYHITKLNIYHLFA